MSAAQDGSGCLGREEHRSVRSQVRQSAPPPATILPLRSSAVLSRPADTVPSQQWCRSLLWNHNVDPRPLGGSPRIKSEDRLRRDGLRYKTDLTGLSCSHPCYLARIHAPIGLDIDVVSPAEIALSILAEIIATPRRDRRRSL